jgi:CheY-like chemotaxis protein
LGSALENRRILVVEDEAIIALALEDMLIQIGCAVVGPAFSVTDGQRLAASEPVDGAVLDINVGGETSEAVARTLDSRGIPFLFSTGYGVSAVPHGFKDRPVLQKPYTLETLGRALERMMG